MPASSRVPLSVSAFQLGERLFQLGIRPGQSRSAALFQLATDLPAAILANMLGIHISVAVQWQRASAGDWTGYAADVSRRTSTSSPAEVLNCMPSDLLVREPGKARATPGRPAEPEARAVGESPGLTRRHSGRSRPPL